MSPGEDIDIREVQTVKLRDMNNTTIVTASAAIRETGLEEGSFRFDPGAVDEIGMLPAIGSEEDADGRSDPLARPIYHEGKDGETLSLGLPKPALEALGISREEIDWESPPELTVWAGDRLLAFERPDEQTVTIDRGEDTEEDDHGE